MIHCDICGKETKEMKIIPQKYRVNGVKEICNKCSTNLYIEINKIEIDSKKIKKDNIKKIMEKMKFKGD